MTQMLGPTPFGGITSAITDGIRLEPCAKCNLPLMKHRFLVAGVPLALVGVILLIKLGFDKLEARLARGFSPKAGDKSIDRLE